MYFVKYGDKYLHDPRVVGCTLTDLSLTCDENSCGFCDFTMNKDHPMYDKLTELDITNMIEVYDDECLIFSGFIYEIGKEFYLSSPVKCKGELDYLNDSIVRPYSTLYNGYRNKAPESVNDYFEWLIEQHNEQVDYNKRFIIGINEGHLLDNNNYIYRENSNYPTTLEELKDKLLNNDNVGGYIRIRHDNGNRYIDYISEWKDVNSQILDFGRNLTDYSQTDSSDEVKTCILPLGASMNETEYSYDDGYRETADRIPLPDKEYYTYSTENKYYMKCDANIIAFEKGIKYYEYLEEYDETNKQLTIDDVEMQLNEDDFIIKNDVVFCDSAVKKYGWRIMTYSNYDITEKQNLVKKAIVVLKDHISPKRTIEIKAIDMHMINNAIQSIKLGEYVRVRSVPHSLDSYYVCRSIDLDLSNPSNSTYVLGTTYDIITGEQNKKINELNNKVLKHYESVI